MPVTPPPAPPAAAPAAPTPAHLELKAAALLVAMLVLIVASTLYLLYARGAFERTQELTLITDDAEGVAVGMDMTFSGFPIGRVRRVDLVEDGKVRILVDIPVKDAHWLRETSVFVLARGLVGDTRLRAYSGVLTDPALPAGATRTVLRGDATTEVPKLVAAARELVDNLARLSAAESPLAQSLAHVQAATEKLNGPRGALGLVFGNDTDAQRVNDTLQRTHAALTRLDGVLRRVDGVVARADEQVLGPQGLMRDVQAGVVQLRELLQASQDSLRKVDAVLEEARGIAGNVRGATTDLDALRAEVETSLRRIDHLIQEVNRRWPFKRDTQIQVP
jgi:phospholipid/cholesterol/gamma-HCH transport system substrate-binding protein